MAEGSLTPCVVVMAGLPGTGKSSLARALGAELGGIVLDKDEVRAALFGDEWTEYSTEQDDFCVELMLETAQFLLGRARVPPVIFIDGRTFSRRCQLDRVLKWAVEAGCEVKIIETTCSDETVRRRLQTARHHAKNRDYELYLRVKQQYEGIDYPKLIVNTDQDFKTSLEQALAYLREASK